MSILRTEEQIPNKAQIKLAMLSHILMEEVSRWSIWRTLGTHRLHQSLTHWAPKFEAMSTVIYGTTLAINMTQDNTTLTAKRTNKSCWKSKSAVVNGCSKLRNNLSKRICKTLKEWKWSSIMKKYINKRPKRQWVSSIRRKEKWWLLSVRTKSNKRSLRRWIKKLKSTRNN